MESNLVQNLVNLKSLPETWAVKDFKEVVSDNSGGNKKLAKSNFLNEGEIAVVDQGKKLIAGYYNDTSLAVKTQPPYVVFGDHTRAFKYVDFPFIMGADGTKVLQPKKEDCTTKYLYYFFLSINVPNTGYNRHFKYLKNLIIPLPPLDQQKKIAAILDAADAYRQKTKALIEKYDELTQSLFLDMFGDPVTNPKGLPTEQLGDLCDFYSGRAWKKGELGDKGYKLVRISNLHKPSFPYWLYDGEMIEKHKVEQGDLLFSWAGVKASIDSYIYEGEVAMINQHIYNIKPKSSDISKLYLFNLLQLHLENLRKSLGGGVGQFHLKKSDITSIKVLIPDSNSMENYMQSLNSLKNQKAQAQASLAQAEDLFNSLLQRAFKGELV